MSWEQALLIAVLGLLGGFGIIIGAIATGGDVMLFVNVPSLLIVIGGTFGPTEKVQADGTRKQSWYASRIPGVLEEVTVSLQPQDACDLIRTTVTRALRRLDDFRPLTMEPPYELRIACTDVFGIQADVCIHLFKLLLQIIHVPVRIPVAFGLAKAHPVDDRSMVQSV